MKTHHRWKALGLGLIVSWGGMATAQDAPPPPSSEGQPAPVPAPAPVDLPWNRFSLIYSPEIDLSNSSLGQALRQATQGAGLHNIGLETSTQTGWVARYHAQLDYTYGYGFSGVRLEPLGFGWALPLVRTRALSLEIEPLLSLADGLFLFTTDAANNSNVTFVLSAGAEVQANLVVGPIYVFASPVGIELRYLEVTSGAGGTTTTGADPLFRFRIGVGVQY